MGTQLVLAGRQSAVLCCEFIRTTETGIVLHEDNLAATIKALEVRSWGGEHWRVLGTVTLRITPNVIAAQARYIAHDNYT